MRCTLSNNLLKYPAKPPTMNLYLTQLPMCLSSRCCHDGSGHLLWHGECFAEVCLRWVNDYLMWHSRPGDPSLLKGLAKELPGLSARQGDHDLKGRGVINYVECWDLLIGKPPGKVLDIQTDPSVKLRDPMGLR